MATSSRATGTATTVDDPEFQREIEALTAAMVHDNTWLEIDHVAHMARYIIGLPFLIAAFASTWLIATGETGETEAIGDVMLGLGLSLWPAIGLVFAYGFYLIGGARWGW